MNDFLRFLLAMIVLFIVDQLMIFMKLRNAKKCNYNCENCKNWDCFKLDCDKKRKELNYGKNVKENK